MNQSRNPDIQPGGPRRLTAASAVTVLDAPTGPVSRAQGDLHPGGNPHFMTDPRRAAKVAQAIAARLAQLDPASAASYGQRAEEFLKRLAAAQARWEAKLAPLRGKKIFTKHRTMTYFLDWSGIVVDGEVEPRPGVPPPPSHLADLVELARRDGVKAITVEDYYDPQACQVVARHSGATVVLIPGDVGGEPGLDTYEQYLDAVVGRIAAALR